MFQLYNALWERPEVWADIALHVECSIPSLISTPEPSHSTEGKDDAEDTNSSSTDVIMQEPAISTPGPSSSIRGKDDAKDTNPSSSDVLYKASFVDLRTILSWSNVDSTLRLLCPYFLIREEYKELDKYLDDQKSLQTLLVGQPGIGLLDFFPPPFPHDLKVLFFRKDYLSHVPPFKTTGCWTPYCFYAGAQALFPFRDVGRIPYSTASSN